MNFRLLALAAVLATAFGTASCTRDDGSARVRDHEQREDTAQRQAESESAGGREPGEFGISEPDRPLMEEEQAQRGPAGRPESQPEERGGVAPLPAPVPPAGEESLREEELRTPDRGPSGIIPEEDGMEQPPSTLETQEQESDIRSEESEEVVTLEEEEAVLEEPVGEQPLAREPAAETAATEVYEYEAEEICPEGPNKTPLFLRTDRVYSTTGRDCFGDPPSDYTDYTAGPPTRSPAGVRTDCKAEPREHPLWLRPDVAYSVTGQDCHGDEPSSLR